MLKGELEHTKSELAEMKTYERKRKLDLGVASVVDVPKELDEAIYICPSDNTVYLRTLLSRMKCLE